MTTAKQPHLSVIGISIGTLVALLWAAAWSGCSESGSRQSAASSRPAHESATPSGAGGIVIDGDFDDWSEIAPALVDPIDAAGGVVDIGAVRITDDPRFVHLLIELGGVVNVQRLDGSIDLLFDVDGDHATGATIEGATGVDAVLTFTAPDASGRGRDPMGIGLRSAKPSEARTQAVTDDAQQHGVSPYDVGFTFAPTHASDTVEMRIERGSQPQGTPSWFTSQRTSVRLVARDAHGLVIDATDTITHEFATTFIDQRNAASPAATIPTCDEDAFRTVSWNVKFGGLVEHAEAFAPILDMLQPDVLLLQEIRDSQTPKQIKAALNGGSDQTNDNAEPWHVLLGAGGGNLRCALAARAPLRPAPTLHEISYRDSPDRSLRIAGGVVTLHGMDVLIVSVHLRCCGSIDSREESIRLEEAELIAAAVRQAVVAESVGAVVIAGDLNLVGGRGPLEALISGGDVGGNDLVVAQPLQLDRRSNATWHDHEQPFVPGRLDYLMFSGSTLKPDWQAVLDSRDLAPQALRMHGLEADGTMRASDHFPLVVDLRPTSPQRRRSDAKN